MSRKSLIWAAVISGGLLATGGSASAQDWWNPGTWFTPAYRTTPVYGGCANGQCSPSYGYGRTSAAPAPGCNCVNGACTGASCGPNGCRPATYGYSVQPSVVPVYRSPAPYGAQLTPKGRTTYYRPSPVRTRLSPFYE
jgi:hypothetical protein